MHPGRNSPQYAENGRRAHAGPAPKMFTHLVLPAGLSRGTTNHDFKQREVPGFELTVPDRSALRLEHGGADTVEAAKCGAIAHDIGLRAE
jgi:hypothetical protein